MNRYPYMQFYCADFDTDTAAPATFRCRVCGRVLPRDQAAKYSLTLCRACASRAVRISQTRQTVRKPGQERKKS